MPREFRWEKSWRVVIKGVPAETAGLVKLSGIRTDRFRRQLLKRRVRRGRGARSWVAPRSGRGGAFLTARRRLGPRPRRCCKAEQKRGRFSPPPPLVLLIWERRDGAMVVEALLLAPPARALSAAAGRPRAFPAAPFLRWAERGCRAAGPVPSGAEKRPRFREDSVCSQLRARRSAGRHTAVLQKKKLLNELLCALYSCSLCITVCFALWWDGWADLIFSSPWKPVIFATVGMMIFWSMDYQIGDSLYSTTGGWEKWAMLSWHYSCSLYSQWVIMLWFGQSTWKNSW